VSPLSRHHVHAAVSPRPPAARHRRAPAPSPSAPDRGARAASSRVTAGERAAEDHRHEALPDRRRAGRSDDARGVRSDGGAAHGVDRGVWANHSGGLEGDWTGSGTIMNSAGSPNCIWSAALRLRVQESTSSATLTLSYPEVAPRVNPSLRCPGAQATAQYPAQIGGSGLAFRDRGGNRWQFQRSGRTLTGTISPADGGRTGDLRASDLELTHSGGGGSDLSLAEYAEYANAILFFGGLAPLAFVYLVVLRALGVPRPRRLGAPGVAPSTGAAAGFPAADDGARDAPAQAPTTSAARATVAATREGSTFASEGRRRPRRRAADAVRSSATPTPRSSASWPRRPGGGGGSSSGSWTPSPSPTKTAGSASRPRSTSPWSPARASPRSTTACRFPRPRSRTRGGRSTAALPRPHARGPSTSATR